MGSYFFFFPMILLLAATCYGQGFQKSRASYYGSPEGLGTANCVLPLCKICVTLFVTQFYVYSAACFHHCGDYQRCRWGCLFPPPPLQPLTTIYNVTIKFALPAISQSPPSVTTRSILSQLATRFVKCKIPTYCSEEGAKVVVTDRGAGGRTDFIMSKRGYEKMARPDMAPQLFAYGVVDIEYRRVPCSYNRNLELRIHENSNYPSYLALAPIYKDGMSDITGIDIGLEDSEEWSPMRRAYGTVFDISNPPIGSLHVRINYAIPYEVNLVQLTRAIPTDWKAGVAYDTASQLN
ncbi:expansin-like B1 [Olea europaea var. sylvestris]|uniref:expansin-like B1 n=1 Tax=Olea europaea var. sylvestris TaxID=158386 RepID=UPI000C1CF63D|nr:expansin-like B1 [Olea europaea var. sylvestris]